MFVATRTWLVAVALFVGMASVTAQGKCRTGQTTACISCLEVGRCDPISLYLIPASPPTTCTSSQVCQEYGNTAVCVPASGTNACNNCGSQPTACDPYNPLIAHVCIPGMPPIKLQDCTATQVCRAGACVDGTSISVPITPAAVCAGNGDAIKFYSLKPACTSGVLCLGTNVAYIHNCTSGNYFNQRLNLCKSLPVNHCESVTADGISVHLTNCSNGVVCQGGAVVTEIECGIGQVFSITDYGCIVRSASHVCPEMDGCITTNNSGNGSSTTTARPAICSASNVNKRYPHETKCERYYTCRFIRGTYRYIESICKGTLVYNPTTTKCEKPTSPSCRTSRNDAA
ncbi:uncharacterized protein LOC108683419 isoform X2 [Hyalella azteca]|uniref:Uncharacterized protein LOC108683419 isoform X2 n=1 Tax=Hyalella azteca TaxID=294128 RepID=A0A8B7PSR2_HYAAZ|nr:uncharacterized protein LOC108683419 isoform X2 [Hyalella azteca]